MRASSFLIILASILLVVAIASIASAEDDQPPFWFSIDTFHAVEDVPLIIDFTEFVTDPDTPTGNLTIDSGSPFVVNISGMVVTFLFPNGVFEANVTLEVSDGNATMTATLHFIIEPVNDPPIWQPRLERLPDGWVDEFYSFTLTAVDEDNTLDELTFSTDAHWFVMPSFPEIAFIPRYQIVGYNYFNVTVLDPDGLNDTMELELLIEPFPLWYVLYIESQTAEIGLLFSLNVSVFLKDNTATLPPELRLTFTYGDDSDKIDTDPVTGVVTWTPTNADVGDHFFTITVTDNEGRTDQHEIRIFVPDPGPGPDPLISRQVLTQGVQYIFDVPMNEWYYEHPEYLGYLSFFNEPDDLFHIDPDTGRIDFVPANEDVGEWVIDIIVIDGFGLSNVRTVEFIVQNVNDPPSLTPMNTQLLTEGVPTRIKIEAHDPDMDPRKVMPNMTVDPEESLSFHGGMVGTDIDPLTGEFEFVPDQYHADTSPFILKFRVEDADGAFDTIFVRMHVEDLIVSPEVMMGGLVEGQRVRTDKRYLLSAYSVDESGGPWANDFHWYSGTTIIGRGNQIEWEPKGSGQISLTLVGHDGRTEADTTLNLTVTDGGHRSQPQLGPILIVVGVLGMALAIVVALLVMISRSLRTK
jgi:hypothetical protein